MGLTDSDKRLVCVLVLSDQVDAAPNPTERRAALEHLHEAVQSAGDYIRSLAQSHLHECAVN